MRYASLLLSALALCLGMLVGSATTTLASTQYGENAKDDTSEISVKNVTVDTVTTLARDASGSVPQGRIQTTEVVTVSTDSIINPQTGKALTAEGVEYWSTLDLIEK